jgi:hypothetical protein
MPIIRRLRTPKSRECAPGHKRNLETWHIEGMSPLRDFLLESALRPWTSPQTIISFPVAWNARDAFLELDDESGTRLARPEDVVRRQRPRVGGRDAASGCSPPRLVTTNGPPRSLLCELQGWSYISASRHPRSISFKTFCYHRALTMMFMSCMMRYRTPGPIQHLLHMCNLTSRHVPLAYKVFACQDVHFPAFFSLSLFQLLVPGAQATSTG